MGKKQAPSTNG